MGERRQSAVVATALVVAIALGMTAAHAARTVSVGTATEAWYLTTPLGGAPGGPSLNPYPSGTLHVGVAAGEEESRSYLGLDLSELAGDAQILGGTLLLPVADQAGTRSPEAARIRVCRAEAPPESVEGSTAAPPPADCTISADAVFMATGRRFEVDLEPIADFLDGGLAVVAHAAADDSWHVAFHGSSGDSGDPRITAELELAERSTEDALVTPTFDSLAFSAAVHPEDAPPPLLVGLGAAPSTPSASAAASPPRAADLASPASAPSVATTPSHGGFRYSIVFGLPLVLLIGVPYFGLSLTAPVSGRSRSSSAL